MDGLWGAKTKCVSNRETTRGRDIQAERHRDTHKWISRQTDENNPR